MKYLLDTNVFWDVIADWNSGTTSDLITDLRMDGKIDFCLSEISAMEIHSVLGKMLRGKPKEDVRCTRMIKDSGSYVRCHHIWISNELRPLGRREAQAYKFLIEDILNNRNVNFNIEIIPLDSDTLNVGSFLLRKYAYKYDFHSLDATIAASAKMTDVTLRTKDSKLKNVLKLEGIKYQ